MFLFQVKVSVPGKNDPDGIFSKAANEPKRYSLHNVSCNISSAQFSKLLLYDNDAGKYYDHSRNEWKDMAEWKKIWEKEVREKYVSPMLNFKVEFASSLYSGDLSGFMVSVPKVPKQEEEKKPENEAVKPAVRASLFSDVGSDVLKMVRENSSLEFVVGTYTSSKGTASRRLLVHNKQTGEYLDYRMDRNWRKEGSWENALGLRGYSFSFSKFDDMAGLERIAGATQPVKARQQPKVVQQNVQPSKTTAKKTAVKSQPKSKAAPAPYVFGRTTIRETASEVVNRVLEQNIPHFPYSVSTVQKKPENPAKVAQQNKRQTKATVKAVTQVVTVGLNQKTAVPNQDKAVKKAAAPSVKTAKANTVAVNKQAPLFAPKKENLQNIYASESTNRYVPPVNYNLSAIPPAKKPAAKAVPDTNTKKAVSKIVEVPYAAPDSNKVLPDYDPLKIAGLEQKPFYLQKAEPVKMKVAQKKSQVATPMVAGHYDYNAMKRPFKLPENKMLESMKTENQAEANDNTSILWGLASNPYGFLESVKKYLPTIAKYCKQNNVPGEHLPYLLALAYIESGFQQIPSYNGTAYGIFQLTSGTARVLGVKDIKDADDNIKGGIKFFKQLLDRFDSPIVALAAYNAGPNNIFKYMRDYGSFENFFEACKDMSGAGKKGQAAIQSRRAVFVANFISQLDLNALVASPNVASFMQTDGYKNAFAMLQNAVSPDEPLALSGTNPGEK